MRWRPLTWFLLSAMFFIAALYFWRLGDKWALERKAQPAQKTNRTAPVSAPAPANSTPGGPIKLLSRGTNQEVDPRLAYRLSNTPRSLKELISSDSSILLENALLDTANSVPLDIPPHLRAQGDPGTYIIQSRQALDEPFRAALAQAGAKIIAYIPNNAYLVRVDAGGAEQMRGLAQTRSVVAYEPYFKIKGSLLATAVKREPLANDVMLNLLLFADARDATLEQLAQMGAQVLGEDRSPFGKVVRVQPPIDGLARIAGLPGVQIVEQARRRVLANDLTRESIGVAADSIVPNNYLNLTGTNVIVNVNDSGVSSNHIDLAPRVLFPTNDALGGYDPSGHGTHVAGIIASSGGQSLTVTGAQGSIMPPSPGQFRGKAPNARLLSINIDLGFGTFGTDTYLQETAARTNAFISNNSWHFFADNDYGLGAASYDAAVRDALPEDTGSQPLLYVFSVGNGGAANVWDDGAHNGLGGLPDTIQSPATAKNVISVGAVEQFRDITNEVVICQNIGTNGSPVCVTNKIWQKSTDNASQVARFSNRGNVGIGFDGDFGRFKPDVVAPGSMVVSTRSTQWDEKAYYDPTNHHVEFIADIILEPKQFFANPLFIPDNAVQAQIELFSAVDLPIYVNYPDVVSTNPGGFLFIRTNIVTMPPDNGASLTPRGVDWFYGILNDQTQRVIFSIITDITTTNDHGNFLPVLSNLNNTLGPYYRYESGSSMAAAAVSGTLALMQENFEQRAGQTNSPALMKAMLINGARSVGGLYNFQVNAGINYQGWGKINLPNSMPAQVTNRTAQSLPMYIFDQSPTNALATGQRKTRFFRTSLAAQAEPIRMTLVWTDPPGNPAASLKLVNNLDLVVTNLENGLVYFGNDILAGSDFNNFWDTNTVPNLDVINNVENVYIQPDPRLGTNYSVTVIARQVNVNAVTSHTNGVVQDYALVVSSADGQLATALTLTDGPTVSTNRALVTVVTNGFTFSDDTSGGLLLYQRSGASSPLQGLNTVPLPGGTNGLITIGVTNQWHFFVVSNDLDFTNAAFVTFLPPNLAVPRGGVNADFLSDATRIEADVDLYVSTDPTITNLNPAALAAADKSLGRKGTEFIVFSNAAPNQVYYVGVKSEDQQGGEYGFLGLFSLLPFGSRDEQGNLILRGMPVPAVIPDGTPAKPGVAMVFAIAPESIEIRRVVVTNLTLSHELAGDLLGNLSHNNKFAVLNNKTCQTDPNGVCYTNYTYIYEDNGEGNVPNSRPSDGPGSLKTFVGEQGLGLWLLTEIDNAPSHTGRVEQLFIKLEPHNPTNDVVADVLPNTWFYDFIRVPLEGTNLTVCVSGLTGPVELYIRRGDLPTQSIFDRRLLVNPPGGCITISSADVPPLAPGVYFIGIFNSSGTTQRIRLTAQVLLSLEAIIPTRFNGVAPLPIKDDALTYSTVLVTNDQVIAAMDVGLRVDHPRISDLAFTLLSPNGTRVLLFENRGGVSSNLAGGQLTTNFFAPATNGGPLVNTQLLMGVGNQGTLLLDYDFFQVADTLQVFYDGAEIFNSGQVNGSGRFVVDFGPGVSTDITVVVNLGGNNNSNTVWTYTATVVTGDVEYLNFTENTNLTTVPIKFAPSPFVASGTNSLYFLPEESLDAFKGENAQGLWTLEVHDRRAGATNSATELVKWRLRFWFENNVAAPTPLTHGVTVTNVIGPNGIGYYTVDVPDWARFATNTLVFASGPVDLLFNQNVAPTFPIGGGTVAFLTASTGGSYLLTTNSAPPLIPGARYYLAVHNPNSTNVSVGLKVEFDVTVLTNGVPVAGTMPFSNLPRYFSYNVSTNATAVSFELLNLSGNVNLVARKGVPLPTLGSFDYGSFNPGTTEEAINVFSNSAPVALSPGIWYLAVYNADITNVDYTILATEYTNAFPTIITLFNAIPRANTNSGAANLTNDYYRFVVSSNAVRAQFEINNPTANMTLVTRKGLPLPDLASFDLISANPGTSDETILFFTNSTPVALTPGEWFLTAVNVSGGPASYSIKATEFTFFATNLVITNWFLSGNSFCFSWSSVAGVEYFVQGLPNLNSTNWTTLVSAIIATGPTTSFCVPLPSINQFFRVGEGVAPAAAANGIRFTRILPATNGIRLDWTATANWQFNVQYAVGPLGPWNSFTNVITSATNSYTFFDDGSQSGGLGQTRSYRLLKLP